jgi:hypothetical protein
MILSPYPSYHLISGRIATKNDGFDKRNDNICSSLFACQSSTIDNRLRQMKGTDEQYKCTPVAQIWKDSLSFSIKECKLLLSSNRSLYRGVQEETLARHVDHNVRHMYLTCSANVLSTLSIVARDPGYRAI